MNQHRTAYNKPFSEYAYRRLSRLTEEQKQKLDHKDLEKVNNPKALHLFCENSPKEHIDILFSKCGIPWVQVYGDSEQEILSAIVNHFDIMDYPAKKEDLVARMTEGNIFATGSDQAMLSLQLTARSAHNNVYVLSQYAKDMLAAKKNYPQMPTFNDQVKDAEKAYDSFSGMLLAQLNSMSWVEQHMGVTVDELRLLTYLFIKKNSAVPYKELADGIQEKGKTKYIGKCLEAMKARKLINSDVVDGKKPNAGNTHYMITALGIEKVITYRNYIYDLSFGKRRPKL